MQPKQSLWHRGSKEMAWFFEGQCCLLCSESTPISLVCALTDFSHGDWTGPMWLTDMTWSCCRSRSRNPWRQYLIRKYPFIVPCFFRLFGMMRGCSMNWDTSQVSYHLAACVLPHKAKMSVCALRLSLSKTETLNTPWRNTEKESENSLWATRKSLSGAESCSYSAAIKFDEEVVILLFLHYVIDRNSCFVRCFLRWLSLRLWTLFLHVIWGLINV